MWTISEECQKADEYISKAIQNPNSPEAKFIGSELLTAYTSCDVSLTHLQHSFRSYSHNINVIAMKKSSLSAKDGKRFWLKDGINSLPFGHKDIRTIESTDNAVIKKEMPIVLTDQYTQLSDMGIKIEME